MERIEREGNRIKKNILNFTKFEENNKENNQMNKKIKNFNESQKPQKQKKFFGNDSYLTKIINKSNIVFYLNQFYDILRSFHLLITIFKYQKSQQKHIF